jgi:hypothetical protein
MQLMLNVYEFEGAPPSPYPKKFFVDWVRGYRKAEALRRPLLYRAPEMGADQ